MVKHIVESCSEIFGIKSFLAHGILPLLRIEDIKIAHVITAHTQPVHTTIRERSKELSNLKLPTDLGYYYTLLEEYINQNNSDLCLGLELFSTNRSSEGPVSYLYPIHIDTYQPLMHSASNIPADRFYKGNIPLRRMRLGTFLYYKGIISYHTLLESIEWQKQQRPLLGQIAMQAGFLSPSNFAIILLQTKSGCAFGEIGKSKGLLTQKIIVSIINLQQKYNCRLGRYFVEKGVMTQKDMEYYHFLHHEHNAKYPL